eukprot:UN04509
MAIFAGPVYRYAVPRIESGKEELMVSDRSDLEQPHPRPLSGAAVPNPPPALIPPRTNLVGQYVTLEPQNAAVHAAELFEAGHENDEALKNMGLPRLRPLAIAGSLHRHAAFAVGYLRPDFLRHT